MDFEIEGQSVDMQLSAFSSGHCWYFKKKKKQYF